MPISVTVNGHPHQLEVDAQTPLIYVLRNDLGLYGAKFGCGQEQCGSCLVLADGEPIYSCTATLKSLEGRHVTTIEGLADEASGNTGQHPLQQAFLENNAAQCGYCTAGIIMRAKHLLDSHPLPSPEAIAKALDTHLCRCGAHPRILKAVARAAERLAGR